MRTLKLILRNTVIYSIVFTMFFGSAITDDTVSLMREVVAQAADGVYDGGLDAQGAQTASGGIVSKPCYQYPAIKISIVRDEKANLIAEKGLNEFYNHWGSRYPVTTYESNQVQGSFYIYNHAENYNGRGATRENTRSYKYNGGSLLDEGNLATGQTQAQYITSSQATVKDFGADGVSYGAFKDIPKEQLGDGKWKAYATNTTRALSAWYLITAATGEGGGAGSHTTGIGGTWQRIFNPGQYSLDRQGDYTSAENKELWLRTLDSLMSLWLIAPDNVKPVYEDAINAHINGTKIAIMAEVCPVMTFGSGEASGRYGVITTMDYVAFITGTTQSNLIYGQNWYNNNTQFTGDVYGAITHSVNSSIAEDRNKDRYPATGSYENNAWSWSKGAITDKRIKITNGGKGELVWNNTSCKTAFIEALGVSNGSSVWKAGYTLFGTTGVAPLVDNPPPTAGQPNNPSPEIGVLSATPDNYHLGGATFGTNVQLTLYGGLSEENLGAWQSFIDAANGGNFTIQVSWSRDSGRETDSSGIGTFIDPNIAAQDPFLPSNSVHMSPAEDAKAATVVTNPTTVIFSANEMRDWISGRRAITAYDAIANYKAMHTNTKIDYTANITITCPNGAVIKGVTSDSASFLGHEERIGYASTAQAYSEFKNYGVTSDMDGYLKEDFDAMAGVPSTEQMYFAAGGSEFIVDIGLNEAANETAYRTYDYYYTAVNCEYQSGDQSNETFTVPSYSGILGAGGDYTISVHGGNLSVSQTISGSIKNDAVAVTATHAATCVAIPNAADLADRTSAYASLVAWYNSAMATVITHTSVSDCVTRTGPLSSMGGSYSLPGCPSNVPATTTASAACQAKPASGEPGKPGYVAAIPCANEQCTASPSGAASWSVTATITIPCHVICGPCCEHVIPETHDTWTQTVQYDSMEINNIHVWRIDQGAIEGMEEILDLEYVSADILDDHPTIFYNIAQKNEDMSTYKKPVYGDTYKGKGKYSHHAKVGRMVYSVERDQCDKVVVCLGARDNFCDGLAQTCGHNKVPTTAAGHGHFWAEGFIYTTSNEGYNTGRTGNTRNGETAFAKNPRNTLNGALETYGANLSLNYVTEHTNVAGSWDSKDWGTKEYKGFVEKRNQQVTATMVTDFLILQTTSGVQSVMYFDQSQSTYVDAEMPNIDALNHPYNHDDGGAKGNEVNGVDATAIPGGPIAQRYWFGNGNSASQWDPFEINIGSYSGMYWKGNEGNNGGASTKFHGTGRSNAKATKFDDGPHGSMVMNRPATASQLMMYTGELNLKLDLKNEAYYTDYSEVFFANQLHWAYDNWLRLNPEKNGLHLPYINEEGTSDYANFARLDTGSFVFDGDTVGLSYFFYDTNNHAKSYKGATGNAIGKNEVTKADHQFDIEDYRVAAGYTQEAVYSDSTVGGNDYPKCNDIIIHNPVSTQDTALVSLPDYRDQRTGDIVGGADDVTESINNSIVCPQEPGLCSYRVLNCHFLEDMVIFKTNFTPDADGNFVNSVTGNSLTLQPGFTLDKNNKFDNYALRAYGTRISIPFTEMGISYNTSLKIRVEADIIINPTGKGQMIFSFNKYDVYLPASTEQGLNENKNLTINTGNGWELKASIPIADGRKHHLAVDFAFNDADNCDVYIDGKKATLTRYNDSAEITPNTIGNSLNIGSWGANTNYGANFWIDNFTVTRLAGTMIHGKECYSMQLQHAGGNNAHNHTADCLDSMNATVAPGMVTKEIDGALWGRVFYHNMAGGFFRDSVEVLNTNTTYKYSVLDYIQKLKPQGDDKYTFRLEYGNVVSNIWRQTNRPQDEVLADTTNGTPVTGYEPISIVHTGGYWGGLAKSTTTAKTLIDGSTGHGNWWYSIGTYAAHVNNTSFPGYNNTNVTECSLWMKLDDSYRNVKEKDVSKTFNYTGAAQEYTIPISGYYRLEAWGASSDPTNSMAGQGGYTAGTVYLSAGTKLYIYVGEAGKYVNSGNNIAPATFNGGGAGGKSGLQLGGHQGASGGGASDIRLTGGAWNNTASLQSRILVAGGGGGRGCASSHNPGHGGGLVGATTYNSSGTYAGASASGGSQTAGGTAVGKFKGSGSGTGGFGYGATAGQCAAGGGGGWYGGGSEYTAGGGGGSSYVNGYPGCNTTYKKADYEFTNVALTQGGNTGNGKVTITRMTSTLANVLYWLYSGDTNEEYLRDILGDAYEYVVTENQMTELYTYSNWSKSNNGFYHLTTGVEVDINKDGSFTIDTVNGWECASAVDIDGSALRNIVITYRGNEKPNTTTGVQFVYNDGTLSKSFYGTYTTNENGDTVCTIELDSSIFGNTIGTIKYDLGSGSPTTKTATVKSIQLNGYGTSSTQTKVYTVSKSNTPGKYIYETNAFGNSLYDVELIGARGGDARLTNTTTVVKNSGGQGANVFGQASFGKNDILQFTVGGKGENQASTASVSYSKTQVASKTTSGSGSYTFKKGKTYLIEAYGASGGGGTVGTGASHGGYGGYTTGIFEPTADTTLYYYVGGKGTAASALGAGGGYNGGGHGGPSGYGGGGMTHVSTTQNLATVSVEQGDISSGTNTFNYTGGVQSFTAPASGNYTLKVYGAKGGNDGAGVGGYGGYSTGTVYLTKGQVIYIVAGGAGGSGVSGSGGGYNGGGNAGGSGSSGAGGGATHIATTNRGVLSNYASYTSEVLIVAGGGGGGGNSYGNVNGGVGGGTSHNSPSGSNSGDYAFGRGQNHGGDGGGGGGGWYGGYASNGDGGGSGGTGYIGGVTGGSTTNGGGSSGHGYATIEWNINNFKVDGSWNPAGTVLVAGGGGGADNSGGTAGGADDGSGGNGGGTEGGNAYINGVAEANTGATQSAGFMQGAAESVSRSTDTGGAGAGWYGGKVTNNNNGGAGGGSGYVNLGILTDYYKGFASETTTQTSRTGDGAIYIYELSTNRTDGLGGYNGGGDGGTEFGESQPESGAGGGGATDLRVMNKAAGGETYTGDKLSNAAGTESVSGTTLTITSTANYNVYKGGNVARTQGDRYIVTWYGTGLDNSKIVIDGGIYSTDGIEGFQKGRGVRIESVTKTATKITAVYIITETSKITEFRLQTNGAQITLTNKTVQLDDSVIKMVAGGGGGAASHLTANTVTVANGGNASTLGNKAAAPNQYVEAGTPQGGYSILAGQNGADGVRSNNYGAVAGSGGGYYGGRQIAQNKTSNAIGGAGGGTYASNEFTKTSSVLKDSPDGSGNGYYKLDEYRETIIIRDTNYNSTSSNVLMQYYTLIPDKLKDGTDNPLWSNCKKEGNYHECTSACKEVKMLTCSEPHHQGLHYDVANEICWEACMNDANHRKSTSKVQVDNDYSFDIGNFINIDYGFTIFFPNRGYFDEGESYAIGALSSSKGLGYRDVYEVDEDYSELPYGRGTDMSHGYVNTDVGMNTSKWTRVKRIKLPVNVIYDPTRDGKHAKLYLAGEWIILGDRGTYESKIGGQGDTAALGKYDETEWSNYGTWKYEGVYKEFYNFYCVLNNPEIKAGPYTVEVTGLNASSFTREGTGQKNDNPNDITNKRRTSSFYALHGGTNTQYFDVVGRIGNMIMDDVEDFRFSNLFKQAITEEAQKQVTSTSYYVNKGLGTTDSAGTDNPNATTDGNYVMTNAGNAFAVVKGVSVNQKYYKVAFEGKGLNVGRFEAVNVATKQPIDDVKVSVIQESSNKVSYYLDLSSVEGVSKVDLKFIAKGSNVMAVNSCTLTELGSTPESWLLDGIVREVDETRQNVYFTWVADIRGIKVSSATKYINTWGTLSWANDKWKDFPLSPDKNNIDILKDEPMLAGYSALMDIQTIGSYWKNDIAKLQIIPKYYALDLNTGLLKKIDVYMEHEGNYVAINLADNVNKNSEANPFNAEIFNNTINLDWDNTKLRRNVTDAESTKTQQVYEDSIRKEAGSSEGYGDVADVDVYRPLDIPRGHINVLGNNQYMVLDGNARSFVGGVETYGSLKNLGNRLNPVHWFRSAQRWHFLVGIPSSAVFVEKGQVPNAANIEAMKSGPYTIICTLDITAIGEIYALKYEQKYSGSQIATDYTRYYKNIVKDWTDVGTTGGVHMGSIKVTSNGITKTISLNQYAQQLNYEPIVFVYSVNESSVQDVEIVGTH